MERVLSYEEAVMNLLTKTFNARLAEKLGDCTGDLLDESIRIAFLDDDGDDILMSGYMFSLWIDRMKTIHFDAWTVTDDFHVDDDQGADCYASYVVVKRVISQEKRQQMNTFDEHTKLVRRKRHADRQADAEAKRTKTSQ